MSNLSEIKVTGFEDLKILTMQFKEENKDGVMPCYAVTISASTTKDYILFLYNEVFLKYIDILKDLYEFTGNNNECEKIYGINKEDIKIICNILNNSNSISAKDFLILVILEKYGLRKDRLDIISSIYEEGMEKGYPLSKIFMEFLVSTDPEFKYQEIEMDVII